MRRKAYFIGVSLGVMAAIIFSLIPPEAKAQESKKITLRWGSSRAGSAAYVVLFGVAKVVNDRARDIYIEAVPTGGSIASQRMMAKGELDGCYSGTWNLLDIYQNRGPYQKSPYPPEAARPYQTWHCYFVKQFVVVKADRTDIKSWRDLAGKKVYVPVPGASVFEVPKAAMMMIGVWDKVKAVDIPMTAVPDALNMGTIDAAFGYANGDVLIPWMAEVDSRVKIRLVSQTPEELDLIKRGKGYSVEPMDAKKVFSQPVGLTTAYTIADFYGFHIGKNLAAARVYAICKILIENAKEIEKVHAMMADYAKDPLGMQVKAIERIPEIPVHPGLAKYLQERGVWQKEWKIGKE
jgi:TRAP transporter TAXI family solute receptor